MEKAVSKLAGLGVPGLILIVAISATGLTGAAAITAALAALGPGGIIGGIITLGVIGMATTAISEYGVDSIFNAVVNELYLKGETKESLKEKISKYPVSSGLKAELLQKVDNYRV